MDMLSIAASGIAVAQVAGAVGGALLKLKQLWDEIQDVPETIPDLMEQLECLEPGLWEAEQSISKDNISPLFWDDTAARRSTEYCRKALDKLLDIARDLSVQIEVTKRSRLRRNITRVKVVLKKDQLRKLEQRLEKAVCLLHGAQQGYIM
jgi:hypothetical protein